MTKEREALRMALETLEKLTGPADLEHPYDALDLGDVAIVAIKEVLAQPEQEPVGGLVVVDGEVEEIEAYPNTLSDGVYSLYTAPPKRQPLTDMQKGLMVMEHLGPNALMGGNMSVFEAFQLGVDSTESAHDIKVEQ